MLFINGSCGFHFKLTVSKNSLISKIQNGDKYNHEMGTDNCNNNKNNNNIVIITAMATTN